MEIMKLVVIVLLLLTNVFCQDVDNWRGAREENKWPNSEVIEDVFVRLIRKPGPRQYLGIMGKKYPGHNFQTFVGLMGKRSFEDDDPSPPPTPPHILPVTPSSGWEQEHSCAGRQSGKEEDEEEDEEEEDEGNVSTTHW
ncbi:unnamed protein product [Pleuronectes platessa]|uniref:Uncharacterized protein n=1 Tax=Pleuronectes platessa TaxID=8262 RepID=A0A9N7TNJ4_PLEPL|nr:unnamed protein product [Pleuronectes platessa]